MLCGCIVLQRCWQHSFSQSWCALSCRTSPPTRTCPSLQPTAATEASLAKLMHVAS
jgi:hypothetical protein